MVKSRLFLLLPKPYTAYVGLSLVSSESYAPGPGTSIDWLMSRIFYISLICSRSVNISNGIAFFVFFFNFDRTYW